MVKMKDSGDGPKPELSKHQCYGFMTEGEREARFWVQVT